MHESSRPQWQGMHRIRHLASLGRGLAFTMARDYFPALSQRCMVCGISLSLRPAPTSTPLAQTCAPCAARLPQRTSGFCPRCAQVFAEPSQSASLCLDCRLAPPPWEQVLFYGPYDDLLKSLILRFKFHAQLGLGHVLGQLLRLCLDDMDMKHYDLIVPIPLHPDRLRSRGFNQSLELARTLARSEYAPLSTQALLRTRNTPAQHSLPRSQRMHNLDGAFHADAKQLKGLSILLVDDILTTGATARAATQALLQAKAADVTLLVLARA
jgi:ComF family protein